MDSNTSSQSSELIKYGSDARRWGKTKNEEYMYEAFRQMGIPIQLSQVFCFKCGTWFTWGKNEFPKECFMCKHKFERGDFAMPDLLIPNYYAVMPDAVIYINSEKYHRSTRKQRAKDKDQIEKYNEFKIKVFIIDNEEIDKLRHANRCLLALGIKAAIDAPVQAYYYLAYKDEKELLP